MKKKQKIKPMKAYMLASKGDSRLVFEAGISTDKEAVRPNILYKDYFKTIPVLIMPLTHSK